MAASDQTAFDARFEWGANGLRAVSPGVVALVVVDVLSFSTAVDVALARGARVYPWRWRDVTAARFAEERGALLAVGRREMTSEHPFSLSPVSLRHLEPGSALVLPSPNGSSLCVEARELGASVLVGSLRNARAVARFARGLGGPVAVVAAGERWPDDSLRPSLEDLLGAGAILSRLDGKTPSPEAVATRAAFEAIAGRLEASLLESSEGRFLAALGFADDVREAAALDVSDSVPRLEGDLLVNAAATTVGR